MVHIKILGTECPKCKKLEELSKQAAKENEIEFSIEKVSDINKIIEYGIMTPPALVINEELMLAGKVPSLEDLKKIIV